MGEIASDMLTTLWLGYQTRNRDTVDEVIKMDDKVDVLSERILEYMSEIQQESLSDESSHTLQALMSATINIESLADVVETELADICKKFIDYNLEESDETITLFAEFAKTVLDAFDRLVDAIKNNDENAAAEVIMVREQVRHSVDRILKNQAGRIGIQTSKQLLLVRLELEMVDHIRRIYTLTKRIAKDFIPEELALKAD